ncbi:MAG: hypothetical protein EPO35_04425, partial [Acidobacteria bacterium]
MNSLFANPSNVGLALEAAAVLMIASMCLTLLRTAPRSPLASWTAGWICLFIALMVLLLAFRLPSIAAPLQPLYLFFEYIFGYLVFAGCREYATGRVLAPRDGWMGLVFIVPALALPALGAWQFNVFYPFHALIYAYLFFSAWRQLAAARARPRG